MGQVAKEPLVMIDTLTNSMFDPWEELACHPHPTVDVD